ncbi:isopropylmalate/homocitrate/citramalate synthase [Bradyrhizobium elkanii]|uniref:Isopropylmalate/homocitrate/citramalate synthase n=2 Tax=Bradyrhizobium elkanii TaxID=29448 RepID=A0ABV4FBB5_BRAEL
MREKAHVREVGPRDGIQMVKTILPSARKLAWCRGAVEAGIREIEVTSFVPAKVIPQFADAEEVARGALAMPGLRPSVLVPNLKGAERAFALGVPIVNYVLSASEEHNQANVRRSTEESLQDFARIAAARAISAPEHESDLVRASRPRSAAPSRGRYRRHEWSRSRCGSPVWAPTRSSSPIRSAMAIRVRFAA